MELTNDDIKRFWSKVNKQGQDECWQWTSPPTRWGYGQFHFGDKYGVPLRAHRVAWFLTFGEIPERLLVCHHCDNKLCVNPAHLYLGNYSRNLSDAWKHQLRKPPTWILGEKHHSHKLNVNQVQEIRNIHSQGGEKLSAIARLFNVSATTVQRIVSRRIWKHVA